MQSCPLVKHCPLEHIECVIFNIFFTYCCSFTLFLLFLLLFDPIFLLPLCFFGYPIFLKLLVEKYQNLLFNQLIFKNMPPKKNMNFVSETSEDSRSIDIFKLQSERKLEEKKEKKSNTIYVISIAILVVCIISLVYI